MKKILFLSYVIFCSCSSHDNSIQNLEGIWIPKSIPWPNGNFKTLCFLEDSSFSVFISTQKLIKDSIYFQAEPGFTFSKGRILDYNGDRLTVTCKVLYRYISMPGDVTPSKSTKENILVQNTSTNVTEIIYNDVTYIKALKYTNKSRKNIIDFSKNLEHNLP